jgi:chromosome segregation ATPase
MSSLGFVARMANWLRGDDVSSACEDHAPEPPAPRAGLAPPPAAGDGPPVEDARRLGTMRDLASRFAEAAKGLEEIRDRLTPMKATFEDLPETMRAQTRFLAAISEQLEANQMHLREVAAAMRNVADSSVTEIRTLQRTNQLIDETMKTVGPLVGGLHRMANAMQGLNEASQRHLMCLGILTERHERSLREQREHFVRHNQRVTAMLAVAGLVALAGVVLAVIALVH